MVLKFPSRDTVARTGQLYLGRGIQALTPLLVTFVVANQIGAANFGMYATAQAIAVIATIFIELGFDLTATRRVLMDRRHSEEIAARTVVFKVKISVVVGAIFGLSALLGLWGDPLYGFAAGAFAVSAGNNLYWYAIASRRTEAIVVAEITSAVFIAVCLWMWARAGGTGAEALLIVAAGGFLTILITAMVSRLAVAKSYWLAGGLVFGRSELSGLAYRLANTLYHNALILAVPLFYTSREVGILAVGLRLLAIQTNGIFPLHQMLITESQRRRRDKAVTYVAVMGAPLPVAGGFALLLAVLAFIYSPAFDFMDQDYRSGIDLIALVVVTGFSSALLQTGNICDLLVRGKYRLSTCIFAVMTIVVALSIPVGSRFGGLYVVLLLKIMIDSAIGAALLVSAWRRGLPLRDRLERRRSVGDMQRDTQCA